MKVIVKDDVCIGCGMCVSIEPDVFEFKDNGKADAYGKVTEDNKENVQQAVDSCPVDAIEEV